MDEPRKSTVPWLSTSDDLQPGRRPCWEIESPDHDDKILCLPVWVAQRDEYVIVHATKPDILAMALSSTPRYDVFARTSFRRGS
jgi:hypothetical protein